MLWFRFDTKAYIISNFHRSYRYVIIQGCILDAVIIIIIIVRLVPIQRVALLAAINLQSGLSSRVQ